MRLLFREEDIFIASSTKCVHKLVYINFYDANFFTCTVMCRATFLTSPEVTEVKL